MSAMGFMTTASQGSAISKVLQKTETTVDRQFNQIKAYYDCQGDEDELKTFIFAHDLANFLLWIHDPIIKIYGNIKKTLHLFRCWDDEEYHIVLGIYSNLENMDEVTVLEDNLFKIMTDNQQWDAIGDVVITQR